MINVIGFEGSWPEAAPLAWGAAAVSDEARVWNAVSGLSLPVQLFQASDEETYVSIEPIEVREDYASSPMLVVALRLSSESTTFFRPDFGRLGGVIGKRTQKKCLYFVLKDQEALRQYRDFVVGNVMIHALRVPLQEPQRADTLHLLTQTLVLDPAHPWVQALRVLFSGGNARVRRIAEQSIRDDTDRRTFFMMLNAFEKENEYCIKYEDGIATGGGLDVDSAAKQLTALAAVHRKLRPLVQDRFDFLEAEELPAFRFCRLQAASASLAFSSAVEGESLLQRLSRYYEMQLLQESIRGDIPSALEIDQEFLEAIETIARPTDDTVVYHKPLDSDENEPVGFQRFVRKESRLEATLEVLGFVQGAARGVSVAEVRIFPRLREVVSIDSDGAGQVPSGVEVFQRRNDFLFLPALFTLQRFVDERGLHKFFLKRIQILEDGRTYVATSIPSSVVEGAFLLEQEVAIRFQDGRLTTNETTLHLLQSGHNIKVASEWIARYEKWCSDAEVRAGADPGSRWLRAAKRKSLNAISRVLICLDDGGGQALLSNLVSAVQTKFGVSVRANNTRREIRENANLVTYDTADEEIVRLTKRGIIIVSILRRAMANSSEFAVRGT